MAVFSPAGWDTPTWAQATRGGRVPTCRAAAYVADQRLRQRAGPRLTTAWGSPDCGVAGGPAGVGANGRLFAGRLGHADVGAGDTWWACAYVPGRCVRGRPAATSASRPASTHGLRKSGLGRLVNATVAASTGGTTASL